MIDFNIKIVIIILMLISDLKKDVKYLKGVGERRAVLFKKLGINNIAELLTYYPFRYEDRRRLSKIIDVRPGEWHTILGEVVAYDYFNTSKGKVLKIFVSDNTAHLALLCYNRNYLKNQLKIGTKIFLSSNKFEFKFREFQTAEFDFEIYDENEENINIHTKRIVPIYRATENLSSKVIRTIIYNALNSFVRELDDYLPDFIKKKYNLKDYSIALYKIHFPADLKEIEIVRQRLAYDRLFLLQLLLSLNKKRITTILKKQNYFKDTLRENFIKNLNFNLTNDQKKVIEEIVNDMKSNRMMNRLLMGDVGCGKTLVALIASLLAIENGYQVAFMAPTEILALQHYNNIKNYLSKDDIEVTLLTGKLKSAEKKEALKKIENGETKIIIGTHALIQENVKFNNLSLIIIDEQHKFGVMQRASLHLKSSTPDILVMTATPIPRTLALTVYGDLDISVIKEMPPGRKEVITKWFKENQSEVVYKFLKDKMLEGNQVYVVYPLVSESDKLNLKAAESMYLNFKEKIFKEFSIGLIHGKMKKDEQERVMKEFRYGKINLLVATTVIEVGVDVANATIMVIEHAERFGLSQLHQLRGRIARSNKQAYCILLTSYNLTEDAIARMEAMVKFSSGFKIAEIDLELRGPGDILGTRQTGMPDLRPANILTDTKILQAAREDAMAIVEKDLNLSSYPKLLSIIKTEFSEKFNLIKVG